MTEELGKIINEHSVQIEQLMPGSAAQVFERLSEPQALGEWLFAEVSIDAVEGGQVILDFRNPDPASKQLHRKRGLVSAVTAPRLLAYSWVEPPQNVYSHVTFELEPQGPDSTLLRVTHIHLPPEVMAKVAAGWHTRLEILSALMRGKQRPELMPRFEELLNRYTIALSTSALLVAASPALASTNDAAYKALTDQRLELLQKYDRIWKESDDLKYQIDALKRTSSADTTRAQADLERELKYKINDLKDIERDLKDLDRALIGA